jgi:hypothetical protein
VYYWLLDAVTNLASAYQVPKTLTGGTGSIIDTVGAVSLYQGVIGSELFSGGNYNSSSMCAFSSADPSECGTTRVAVPGTGPGAGLLVPFKSTSQPYIATLDLYTTSTPSITWYPLNSSTAVQTFTDSLPPSWNYGTPFAAGNAVYFFRTIYQTDGSVSNSILYSVSESSPSLLALSDYLYVDTYAIVDVNAVSVLLTGPAGLYRVALPGDAAAVPPFLIGLGSASVSGATEDAGGVYWLQSDGSLFRCSPSSCAATKKALATGVTSPSGLYQDATALYWSSGAKIMRLAK